MKYQDWKFFLDNAGMGDSRPGRAICAAVLARAEKWAGRMEETQC